MDIKNIFIKFETNCNFKDSRGFGAGNIHRTWRIESENGKLFILQKFNNHVFKDPIGLMENTFLISKHLSDKIGEKNLKWRFPSFYKTSENELFYKNVDETYWRLMDYIDHDSKANENKERYFKAGASYGQFIDLLSDLSPKLIKETIPDFHNLYLRIESLKTLANQTTGHFKSSSEQEIHFLLDQEKRMLQITELSRAGKFPVRLVHMDTKLDNILFDSNANPVAIIDLDTVMPGIVHSDFGDALRSFGNTAGEEESDLSKISFSLEVYKEYTRGFASSLKSLLTPMEIETLHLAPGYFAYMQAIRFLIDYLQGSKYYNIKYPENNLVRTRNQIQLLKEISKKEHEMSLIIKEEFRP